MPDREAHANSRDARAWIRAARRGDFATAWKLSDCILERTTNFGDPSQPRHLQSIWKGTPLDDRRVLVRCYHGLGDTIQFARYLPMVRRIARQLTVWAQPKLLELLGTLPGPPIDLLALHDGDPGVGYDVDVEIMELAHVFRTALDTIPPAPYLTVPPAARTLAAPLLSAIDPRRPAIGVAWRGSGWDARRSLAFERLLPLFEACDAHWYSVQFDPRPHEHHPSMREVGATSIAETAALIERLTLLISVDSMPAHLAGALGCPVWTLLTHDADWRWLKHRADSPWYPTMRLFRQRTPGDWHSVIDEVHDTLAATDCLGGRVRAIHPRTRRVPA